MFKLFKEIALLKASIKGQPEKIKKLVSDGTNVMVEDRYGNTPLHYAATIGFKEVVELLLDNGATVDATNKEGITALHLACLNGNIDIVKLLIERGADINKMDKKFNFNSLQYAIAGKHKEVVEALLAKNVEADVIDKNGYTPFENAVYDNLYEIAELILLRGIDINKMNQDGFTLLHLACITQKAEMVKFLLAHGSEVNAKDKNGITPLHYVASNCNIDLYDLLIKNGADINIKDQNGRTPLDYALNKNRFYMAKLLISNGADLNVVTDKTINYVYNENVIFIFKLKTLINILKRDSNYSKLVKLLTSLNLLKDNIITLTAEDVSFSGFYLLHIIESHEKCIIICKKCGKGFLKQSMKVKKWSSNTSILSGSGGRYFTCPEGHPILKIMDYIT